MHVRNDSPALRNAISCVGGEALSTPMVMISPGVAERFFTTIRTLVAHVSETGAAIRAAVVVALLVSVPTSVPLMSTVSDSVPELMDAPPLLAAILTEYVISFAISFLYPHLGITLTVVVPSSEAVAFGLI